MDWYSFFSGVIVSVIGGFILYWVVTKIERPDLEVLPDIWKEKKWVGEMVDDIKYYSSDRGGEAWVDGYDFMIYGISIRNKRRHLLPRKTANISSTTMLIFNRHGDQVNESRECRWWSHELSSIDNLFVPARIDINQRRNVSIPEDVVRNLVFAYCHIGQNEYRIFAIDSDRIGRFNSNDDRIKGEPPYYPLIKIRGDNIAKDIKLEIVVNNSGLSITEIRNFPFK